MNLSTRLLLFILSLIFGVLSAIIAILPFHKFYILSAENISYIVDSIKGNYTYSAVGLVLFLISLIVLFRSLRKSNINSRNYISNVTDFGEIRISTETISGMVEHLSNRFSGLHNIKTKIDVLEGQLYISLKGDITADVNIPETTGKLQEMIKEHIESCTGVKVTEIKIIIANVTTPMRNIK